MDYWQWVIDEVADVKNALNRGYVLTNLHDPEGEQFKYERRPRSGWDKLTLKKFALYHKDRLIYLTFREAQCAYYMMKGVAFKDIAKELFLSPRTIEYYARRVRKKLSCNNKLEVLGILNRCRFAEQFTFD